jgi:cytochrome c
MFCKLLWTTFFAIVSFGLLAGSTSAEMIHLMARKGDVDAVMAEINKGVDVDLPSTRHTTEAGVSPLFVAAKFGRVDVVVALIEAGANIHTIYKDLSYPYAYGTPLHVAAGSGQAQVVEVLLEAGADPNVFDHTIGPPLHLALSRNHLEAAEVLVRAGASERVTQPPISGKLADADLALGEEVVTGCGLCHSLLASGHNPDLQGPPLWGIVGRPVASHDGYEYSLVMAREVGDWGYEELSSFIASPKRYMPGTNMWARGIDDTDRRAAAIAFLRTLADEPVPLP